MCNDVVKQVRAEACSSCAVHVRSMNDPDVAARAKALGIHSVPAVAIDGAIAGRCTGRGVDLAVLRGVGLAVLRGVGLAVLRGVDLAVLRGVGLAVLRGVGLAVLRGVGLAVLRGVGLGQSLG